MKNNNKSKTWNFIFFNCEIHFEFAESVDIRKALETIPSEKATWMSYLCDTNTDTFNLDCRVKFGGYNEEFPALYKAVAEYFQSIDFTGDCSYSDTICYDERFVEIRYSKNTLHVTETIEDDECGYYCPDCGCWIAPAGDELAADEELECEECGKVFKVSDLKFVPPYVCHDEYIIG